MDPLRKNDLVDGKISRLKKELEYNEVELEFAEKKGDDKAAEKYSDRISGLESDIQLLEGMKNG